MLLTTFSNVSFAVNYSTATDTSDSDFKSALTKSSVNVVGSGDAGFVEIAMDSSTATSQTWDLAGWQYRRKINIGNGGSGLTDYQVWIATDEFSSSDWSDITSKAQEDMDDFRFRSATGTALSYWIEPDANTPLGFWIKCVNLPAGTTYVWMYYGNSLANMGSNMSDTGIFYDDFDGTSLDGTKWTIYTGYAGAGSYLVSGGVLHLETGTSGFAATDTRYGVKSTLFNAVDKVMEFKYRAEAIEGDGYSYAGMIGNDGMHLSTSAFLGGTYGGAYEFRNKDSEGSTYIAANFSPEWVWHVIKIISYSDSDEKTEVFKDGSSKAVNTTNAPDIDGGMRACFDVTARMNNQHIQEVDWVRVRKYAATEPTIGSIGTEEGPYFAYGELQSRVHDTTEEGTQWGEISWGESTPVGTDIKLKTRTGNTAEPPDGWSEWYPVGDVWYEVKTGTPIGSPRAQYIQYMSSFTTSISTQTPQLTQVNIQFSTNTATAPNLLSPADDVWLSSSRPVFQWSFADNEVDMQTGYTIQLSTDINFNSVNYSSATTRVAATHQPDKDIADNIYWWRVKTKDTYAKWSVWSSTYQIKIDTSPPTEIQIVWIRADNENQITLEGTATDSGSGVPSDAWWFEETTGNTGGSDSTVWESTSVYTDSGLSKNTQYSYRVKLRDSLENESSWSATVNKKTQPCVWQEKVTTRTGPNAFGFEGDGVWTWKVPVNGGSLVTITAYAQYNSDYGGASKPKFTLYNNGVNDNASMTGGADTWEKLTVSGTPSGKGVLFLKVEGFSTAVDAKYFVDDIQVNQP